MSSPKMYSFTEEILEDKRVYRIQAMGYPSANECRISIGMITTMIAIFWGGVQTYAMISRNAPHVFSLTVEIYPPYTKFKEQLKREARIWIEERQRFDEFFAYVVRQPPPSHEEKPSQTKELRR